MNVAVIQADKLKLQIGHILAFVAFLALQIKFVQMQAFGLLLCLGAIIASVFGLIAAILVSESKNGMLDVQGSSSVRGWKLVILVSIVNLALVFAFQFMLAPEVLREFIYLLPRF